MNGTAPVNLFLRLLLIEFLHKRIYPDLLDFLLRRIILRTGIFLLCLLHCFFIALPEALYHIHALRHDKTQPVLPVGCSLVIKIQASGERKPNRIQGS